MSNALRRAWAKDLDTATLYELLKLRVEVFVVEQATPYPELDGRDLLAETRHFWLEGADGEVICTLRLMEEQADALGAGLRRPPPGLAVREKGALDGARWVFRRELHLRHGFEVQPALIINVSTTWGTNEPLLHDDPRGM